MIPVEIQFKEKIERATKKKKKKKAAEKKEKPPKISLLEKQQLLNELLKMHIKTDEPEIEIVQDPFTLDMNITDALRIIQKNERG